MISELLNEFIYDAKEHLGTAGTQLLKLEANPNSLEYLNTLMGTLHTIKGNSGFLSLNNLYELLHQAENLLQTVREKQCACPVSVINLFLQVLDTVEALLNRLEQGGDDNLDWLPALSQALFESEEQLELEFPAASADGLGSSGAALFVDDFTQPTIPQEEEAVGSCASPQLLVANLITEDLTGKIHIIDLENDQLCENKDALLVQIQAMFEAGLQGAVLDFSSLSSISRADILALYSIGKINDKRISFVVNTQEQADLYRIFKLLKMDMMWSIFSEKEEAVRHLEGVSDSE